MKLCTHLLILWYTHMGKWDRQTDFLLVFVVFFYWLLFCWTLDYDEFFVTTRWFISQSVNRHFFQNLNVQSSASWSFLFFLFYKFMWIVSDDNLYTLDSAWKQKCLLWWMIDIFLNEAWRSRSIELGQSTVALPSGWNELIKICKLLEVGFCAMVN